MEEPIAITWLNDFIFCPVSIYFHSLDDGSDRILLQSEYQINRTASHEAVDAARYSGKSTILQGVSVYCDRYGLQGKIDIFDSEKGVLTHLHKSFLFTSNNPSKFLLL